MAGTAQDFFWRVILRFLQGILRKTGGWMWFLDGEFVVGAW
jgi:hypothetical protein